jgi:peptide deformylase
MILTVIKEPNPILRQKATNVVEITAKIRKLVADMIDTMHVAEGVGLAANQVGSSWNIFVASPDGEKGKEMVFINAVLSSPKEKELKAEGCLSVPGVSAKVPRYNEITVTALDLDGKKIKMTGTGLLAQIFQHEVGHLQGKLYIDLLPADENAEVLKKYRELSATLGKIKL